MHELYDIVYYTVSTSLLSTTYHKIKIAEAIDALWIIFIIKDFIILASKPVWLLKSSKWNDPSLQKRYNDIFDFRYTWKNINIHGMYKLNIINFSV